MIKYKSSIVFVINFILLIKPYAGKPIKSQNVEMMNEDTNFASKDDYEMSLNSDIESSEDEYRTDTMLRTRFLQKIIIFNFYDYKIIIL